VLVPITA